MDITLTPFIEIWFDGMEYGYRIDFQDENIADTLGVDQVVESKARSYTSVVIAINAKIKVYAEKLHKLQLEYQN